jgi:type IV secretory pathway VirB2 component (pilin)
MNSAYCNGFDPGLVNNTQGIPGLENIFKNIWSTIVFIVQILAIACIVITGLTYMLSPAEKKADIKRGAIYLIIGSVLVYGASAVASFVIKAAEQAGIK